MMKLKIVYNDMSIIQGRGLTYRYSSTQKNAIDNLDIDIQEGELVAVLGNDGCGKSTLVKLVSGLLLPQSGELNIAGMDVNEKTDTWQLREKVGMVFQDPYEQFVSSAVEDDVAFGLENLMVSSDEIPGLVSLALARIGMQGFEKRDPLSLSEGQKQRVAIAGVLAIDPDILVLDEVTAMLDMEGRHDVLGIIKELHERWHKTILMVTNYVGECITADRIILMKDGGIVAQGKPEEILPDEDIMSKCGLMPPVTCRLYNELRKEGLAEGECPLKAEDLVEVLCPL